MTETIKFSDWQKLDLRIGKILQVEDIPNADKLYKLSVDLGKELGLRTICAGIKEYVSGEDIQGKKSVFLVNLEPRLLKGIESQGMIMAAGSKESNKFVLLEPSNDIEVGTKVS